MTRTTYSIISFQFPDHYVRHRGAHVELTRTSNDHDRREATFTPTAGLADAHLMSFKAVLVEAYLRHDGTEVWLHPEPTSALEHRRFAREATFVLRPGLADVGWVSLEAYGEPGRYLRHRDGRLWVEPGDDATFDDDATFRLVPGLHPAEQIR